MPRQTQRRMARMPNADVSMMPQNNAAPEKLTEAAGQVALTSPSTRPSKIGLILALLRREGGATLAEMVEVTGWLPHTTRAALTGLRKKGHLLEKTKRHDATCYRVTGGA